MKKIYVWTVVVSLALPAPALAQTHTRSPRSTQDRTATQSTPLSTSPVRDRLSSFALQHPKAVFSACGNTLDNQRKQENKDITLVSEARMVQTGIARVMELQEAGWAYVRP